MLRVLLLVAQAGLAALIGYNSVTSLWGWRDRSPAPRAAPRRLRVVIPAHDEERVIRGILTDLAAQDHPKDRYRVFVVADRCEDSTPQVAAGAGAIVDERWDGDPGKGPALAWHLERHPLSPDETLVVFDADNRIPPNTLSRISDEIAAGHTVVQCYLDATNPDASLIAQAAAMSYWAGNRMVQLARSNLGWSADLGGTGMAITAGALEDAGGFSDTLTEDQDLGVRLLLAGHPVEWLHDVRIGDEKPASVGVTVRQRARWMAGKRAARRRHLGTLLRSPSPARFDMAIRLVQPGRSFVALLSAVLAVVAAIWPGWLFPWWVWAAIAALQFVLPVPFLAREGLGWRRISRYPVLALLAALWVPIRLVSGRVRGWYHTPHTGEVTVSGDGPGQAP
ncbi:MAG: glycosyltransferase [Actinomycetes bacterium]|jgi:cellulose synthase/poly-beta-1,6-N-acetylglucosamine synthase-like glycosyltransferase|nr:MAG: hypothetical protein DIU67_08325 [Actinomycetota bacterium]